MGQPHTITTDPYPIPPVFLSRKIVVIEFVDGFKRSFIDYGRGILRCSPECSSTIMRLTSNFQSETNNKIINYNIGVIENTKYVWAKGR